MRVPRLTLSRVVILAAVVVVGYFLFNAAQETILSEQLNDEERQLQQEIADLQREETELQAIRDYLRTDEYIEGVARHVLGLVRPGESLATVSSAVQPTPTPESLDGEAREWWELLYGR